MAKPVYFYGIHAVHALLSHRPTDAMALFVQQGRDTKASSEPAQDGVETSYEEILQLAEQMGVSVQQASRDKLTALCGSPQHQGVVVHARPLAMADEGELATLAKADQALFLILDQVTDAHNLGACLRTAAAMGVDAVICPKHHSASLTPTVAKVSVGAMEIMPVIAATNLARCIENLKQAGVFVYGTALEVDAKPISEVDLTGKVALIMGSEGDGMRRLTAERCDELVYIPMTGNKHGSLQSLNVSVATGMVLYEASRQRQA
ncbi:23S rRNA (guanosine(2251)-2'-O)-methyltransferase RlmB [Psychrobacter sp. FDAARGOS_221]|uniref:23S rRNA (guanosine(2251)-2'-O)-methyltransferase RlmB n=1 Tax=Psychrobacter sp. FDAARGOS_221 TaxID=1975705 RepID=UPI000BB58FBB|nr:23S rRNA (guanosine(2251)-2'-O)-methyltransferase RlmB [Psychrobacter sp. FDAARGOS_221]PNK60593.1 23S rRNA (guanosine(2251)-2'-O)-methyltransferase RlmB [Psychrobacter sp. FDAARGOS_221]